MVKEQIEQRERKRVAKENEKTEAKIITSLSIRKFSRFCHLNHSQPSVLNRRTCKS